MQKPLLIVMAMRGEAEPIIKKLNLSKSSKLFGPLPTLAYEGEYQGKKIVLMVNGEDPVTKMDMIGTQAATVTTLLGIRTYDPRAILNFGTCGALSIKNAKIGDLVLATGKVWFHTRRIPIPGWEEFGWGGYPAAGSEALAKKIGIRTGVLSTTDSLDHPEWDSVRFDSVSADVADMEGATIAWLAHLYSIPFYSIKGVTDLMDLKLKVGEQFHENFEKVVESVSKSAVDLIEVIE